MPPHPAFHRGDRVVWTSAPTPTAPQFDQLVMPGTYVSDGPAPYVTVRHDGWGHDAHVFADQLAPEVAS